VCECVCLVNYIREVFLTMRSFVVIAAAVALLACFAAGQDDDLPEFIPCSFDLRLVSEIKNLQGEVVASSVDRVMRDGDLDVWRWDSDFTGLNGTLDEQQWIVIWRPDLGNAYHDLGDKCIKNDGRPTMTPRPYQWLLEKTASKAVSWFRNLGSYEGVPAYIYHTTFEVKEYKTMMTVNVYVLRQTGAIVLVNGTAKSDEYLLDLTYTMEVDFFDFKNPIRPSYFIPTAYCTDGKAVRAPPLPSEEFQKTCYGLESSIAARSVASFVAVLLLSLVVLFF